MQDTDNREKLAKLVRFYSSHSMQQGEGSLTGLEDYVTRWAGQRRRTWVWRAGTGDVHFGAKREYLASGDVRACVAKGSAWACRNGAVWSLHSPYGPQSFSG